LFTQLRVDSNIMAEMIPVIAGCKEDSIPPRERGAGFLPISI